MEDIASELLKKIQSDINNDIVKNCVLKSFAEKIESGTATYIEANNYAIEVGDILASAFKNNISADILPDGKMNYDIANRIITPTMQNNYNMVSKVCTQVQKALNDAAKIGINAIQPQINVNRIEGIVNRVSSAENYNDIAWILQEPIVVFSMSVVDESVKQNSEFQAKAGLKAKIVRKIAGGCCEWCSRLAGSYTYPDVPKDIYRRHQRCRCTLDYIPEKSKKEQNVWTKEWHSLNEKDRIEKRKQVGIRKEYNLKRGTDVTAEYEHGKFPGQGKINYDSGYDKTLHENEIEFAEWLYRKLGGDIRLVNEINMQGQKSPDYVWNGRYWDLKTTTTAKAANSALRHGLKQIKDNPGGIILDYKNEDVDLQEVINEVGNRMRQSKRGDLYHVDVMVVSKQEIVKVIRY